MRSNRIEGIPTTVRKTEVRTTSVRSQKCECQQCERDNSANETKMRRSGVRRSGVRMRLCECDFTAIGQNSEMIQIVRSHSLCFHFRMEFGFKKNLSRSLSLFLSRVKVSVRVGSLSPTDRRKLVRESRSE